MSEPEGAVAGRLSVLVEASLRGFKKDLESKVEAASKGVAAKVGIEVDDKGLREQLQAKVDAAAAAVKATVTVDVDVDVKQVAAKVQAAAKSAKAKTTVTVETDTDGVVEETTAAAEEAEKAAPNIFVRMRTRSAEFLADVVKDIAVAKAVAKASGGIDVPVNAGGGLGGGGGFRLRTLFRGGVIFGLLSLIQPAVGAIGQLVAGLTAMVGAAAPAVGVLSAIPISLAAIIQGAMAGKVAFQGMSDAMGLLAQKKATLARGEEWSEANAEKLKQAMEELHPEARKVARNVTAMRGAWVSMRKEVQGKLFSQISDDIKPLAFALLPTLRRELGRTAKTLGEGAESAMVWLRSDQVQARLGGVMKNNNVIFGDFLYMIGQFGKGALDFLSASRKFGRGVGDTMRDVGDWFSGKMEKGRKDGSIAQFLETASEKATQLWNILRQVGGGLAGIFRAAAPSGERLLTMFEGFVTQWHAWVDSTGGQNYLRDWFEGTEDGFVELARLVNDTFKGLAKWADDPKIAGMIEALRTELGPALGRLLESLADDAGEGIINLLTEIVRVAENLEPAVEVIGLLTQMLADLLRVINNFADANPDGMRAIAHIIGGLVVLKTVGRLGKLAAGLAGIAGAAKTAGTAAGPLSKFAGSLGKMGGVVGAMSKNPLLRKAGLIGLLFTGIDIGTEVYKAFTMGKRIREGLDKGFADGSTKSREDAVGDAATELFGGKNGKDNVFGPDLLGQDQAAWLDDLGVDRKRLESEVAKLGTTGEYYKEVVGRLKANFKESRVGMAQDAFGFLPGVNLKGEQSRKVLESIIRLGEETQAALDRDGKKRELTAAFDLLIKVNDTKQTGKNVDAARKAAREQLADQLGMNGQGTMPMLKGLFGARDLKAETGRDPYKELTGGASKYGKRTTAIMSGVTKSVRRTKAEWDGLGDKATKAGREQARGANQGKKALNGVPGKIKQVGNAWTGAAKKATNGAKMTARGAKTLESASKKAASSARNAAKVASNAYNGMAKKARSASKGATQAISNMTKQIKQKVSTLRGIVSKGMDAVVKAVRSKIGPTKAAAKQISTGIIAAFKGLPGKLQTVGGQAMDGLAIGIRARGAAAVAAARDIASQVAAASRSALEVRSPSRVMKRIGEFVMDGLGLGIVERGRKVIKSSVKITRDLANQIASEAKHGVRKAVAMSEGEFKNRGRTANALSEKNVKNYDQGKTAVVLSEAEVRAEEKKAGRAGARIGHAFLKGIGMGKKEQKKLRSKLKDFLTGGFKDALTGNNPGKVVKAFQRFYKILDAKMGKTKAGRARLKAIRREFRDEMQMLQRNAAKRLKVEKALEAARAKVEDLKSRRDHIKETLRDGANEAGNIGNIAAANGGFISPGRLIAQLKRKVAKALEFKQLLAELRQKGLGEEAYTQLVELGFDSGLPIARQLAKGDGAAMAEINNLQAELDQIAKDTGTDTSAHFFDAGIKAGEALVEQLQKDLAKLEDVGRAMAKSFLAEVQSVLGIATGAKGPGLDTPGEGGGNGGGGNKHPYERTGPKNAKCKKCGKGKNHPNHSGGGGGGVGPAPTAQAMNEQQITWFDKAGGKVANAVAGAAQAAQPKGKGKGKGPLVAAGKNARKNTEARDGDGGGDRYEINLSGIPDKATAQDVLGETKFQMKKIKAGGKRGRGTRK